MSPSQIAGEHAPANEREINDFCKFDLVRDGAGRFRIHSSVYTDQQIFDRELKHVFGHSWIFVSHEDMIPLPGDYVTTNIGTQPVIVCRAADNRVHVLFNRCAHRGSVVCREERGHAEKFRCPYHGWVYGNDGQLIGVAQRSGYPDDFLAWDLKLEEVPRAESYRGLVFANLDPSAAPLLERISSVRRYIDLWCDRSPTGKVALPEGIHRYEFPGNWKLQAENGVDGYHGNYVHESFVDLLERSGEREADDTRKTRNTLGSHNFAKGLSHGDGVLERKDGMIGAFPYRSNSSYCTQLETSYGSERANDILMQRNIFIFPNLFLFESHIRVIHPVRPDKSYIDAYPTYLMGVDDQLNAERLSEHERFFGPSGFGAPDDIEVFVCAQTGASAIGNPWLEFSRGIHRESMNELGETIGHSTDETPQRSLYREWLRLMQVNGNSPKVAR